MNLFGMIDESGGAMQAERMRAEVVAANMANAETTRTAAGTPYRRQSVVFAEGSGDPSFAGAIGESLSSPAHQALSGFASASLPISLSGSAGGLGAGALLNSGRMAPGVHIAAVVQDSSPPLKRYDPSHPDADAEGYVSYPDINPLTEMVDLMGATRAYGLNASAVQAEKSMITSALEIAK
jgi:flagellar basal-body rod protein FlgC